MTDGIKILTIPRANPVDAYTLGGIVKDAGLVKQSAPLPSYIFCQAF